MPLFYLLYWLLHRYMKKFALLFSDLLILYGALALTLFIRYPHEFENQVGFHVIPFSFLNIIWLLVFYINNLYDTQILRNTTLFYTTLLRSILIAGAASVAFFYITPIFGITPRANLFLFMFLFALLEIANRGFFNRIIEKRFHRRTMIVGINPISLELAQFFKQNPQLGYDLRSIVDINPETLKNSGNELAEFGIIQGLHNIDETIRKEKIAIVILSPEAYQMKEIIEIFYKSLEYRVNFYNLATMYEKVTGRVPLDAINQVWFLENINEGTRKAYEATKRGIDIIFALLLGGISLVLLPFVTAAVILTSPGPLFYHQQRVGRLGKVFQMTKLRTMTEHAERETGAVWAQENDPRVTPVGKFLRKTRIDELPQIWNILKGEMSFIGPRAERPEFHEKLMQEVPYYEERYLVKPGATGWAQLQKSYYASITETKEKLQYDLYYIKNRSLLLDAGIMLKTLNLVLRGGGR